MSQRLVAINVPEGIGDRNWDLASALDDWLWKRGYTLSSKLSAQLVSARRSDVVTFSAEVKQDISYLTGSLHHSMIMLESETPPWPQESPE